MRMGLESRVGRWGWATFACATILLASTQASAQVPLDIGLTVKGGVNASALDKPSTKEFQGQPADPTYPGFFGLGGQVGFLVEPRIFDVVGLEFGVIWESSTGEGEVNSTTVTVSSTDLILPLQLRGATPGPVNAVLGIGLDFIVPLSSDVTLDPEPGVAVKAEDRTVTTYLSGSLGAEIDAVYVRIPIEFRARLALGMDDTYDDRITEEGFIPNWQYEAELMVGVTYVLGVL